MLVLFLLALVQTALVARDEVLVQDAARAAAREASVGAAACPRARRGAADACEVSRSRCTARAASAIRSTVVVRYVDHTNLPLVGPLFPDVVLHASGDDARRTMRRNERGNVSIIAVAGVGLALVLCLGVARVGAAAALQARADTAADAAALAGADALALGRQPATRSNAPRAAAADNGARLVSCSCAGDAAEVIVEIGRAHGRARAELTPAPSVDLSRAPALAP